MGGFIKEVRVNPREEIDRSVFPWTLPALRDFTKLDLHPQVTFFVGENGSGKSTLLEAIATNYGFSAEGGSKENSFTTFDSHTTMGDQILLAKQNHPGYSYFFRSETFYTLATYLTMAAKEGGGVPRIGWTHERSHGEGFLDIIKNLPRNGLYMMDEPESALSIRGQLILLGFMKKLVDEGCQFVIATHSPVLLGFGKARIYRFGDDGVEKVDYEHIDSYMLTLDFLRNRQRYARELGLDDIGE